MHDRFVIAIPEPFPASALAVLDERFQIVHGRDGAAFGEDELIDFLRGADAVALYSRDRLPRRVIEAVPRLRVIAKGGSKPTSNVDIEFAERRGIRVLWTPGANAVSVAEMAVALMLMMLRRLPETSERVKRGGWRSFDLLGHELARQTLGIVGFGAIGKEVAKRYRAFGGPVLAFDPQLDRDAAARIGVRGCDLEELLREAHVVSLHCEMNPSTSGLIDRSALSRMRPGALLINTARGGLVDEAALLDALNAGALSGAALDVFAKEPPDVANPLLSHPRVFPTPHVAAFTHESIDRESSWALEDASRVLLGLDPLHFGAG